MFDQALFAEFDDADEELWELRDLETPRVDLVRSPANRRRFLVLKSEEEVNMDERLDEETIISPQEEQTVESQDKEEPIAAAENLTDDDRNILKRVLELLQPLRDKLNPVLLETLAVAAGYPKGKYPTISPYPQPAGYPQPATAKSLEKALEEAGLPGEERERIIKALQEQEQRAKEAIEKERKALFERLEAIEKENQELRERLQKEELVRKQRDAADFLKKEYPHLPVSPEGFAPIFLKLQDALSDDELKELQRILKAADDIFQKAGFLEELGSEATGEDDPEKQLEARAKELAEKDGISLVKAKAQILKQDRELYKALRARR